VSRLRAVLPPDHPRSCPPGHPWHPGSGPRRCHLHPGRTSPAAVSPHRLVGQRVRLPPSRRLRHLHRSAVPDRTEDRTALEPMLNDLRAARFRYNELAVGTVLDELAVTAAGLCDETTHTRSGDWDRFAIRLPGEARTARWLVRQAMHEGRAPSQRHPHGRGGGHGDALREGPGAMQGIGLRHGQRPVLGTCRRRIADRTIGRHRQPEVRMVAPFGRCWVGGPPRSGISVVYWSINSAEAVNAEPHDKVTPDPPCP